jgi:CheY-like chemotaxis protein
LHFDPALPNLAAMKAPLAILLFERVLPGSQLVNRLQDLGYRVQTLTDGSLLVARAEQERPLLVIADLNSGLKTVLPAIANLTENPATAHIPVIAFSTAHDPSLPVAAREAGAHLVVTQAAISQHLPQLLEQALTNF